MDKMEALLEEEGMTFDEFLEEYSLESVVPGICTNAGCSYVSSVEPDQSQGWCDHCGTTSVVSGLILAGVL